MNPDRLTPDEPTSELRIGSAIPWATGFAVLLGFSVLGVLGFFSFFSQQSKLNRRSESLQQAVEANNQFDLMADRAQAKAAWGKVHTHMTRTVEQLESARQLLTKFEARITELETSELGRRLANDGAGVTAFGALKLALRPSLQSLQQDESVAKDYCAVANRALEDDAIIVGPRESMSNSCSSLEEKVNTTIGTLNELTSSLNSLLTSFKDTAPASITLAEALQLQAEERGAAQLANITRAREQIQQDARIKQLENERLTEQALQQAETERLASQQRLLAAEARAASDRERMVVEEAEAKIAAEKANAEKLKLFEKARPEIEALLSPMISSGRMQLGNSGWTAGEEGPVSLTALKGAKALELNTMGTITLASIFCGPLCRNDRPRGAFPENLTTHETTIRRAQELLVEFGEILVAKGMLRP